MHDGSLWTPGASAAQEGLMLHSVSIHNYAFLMVAHEIIVFVEEGVGNSLFIVSEMD